jgi:HlyD family secretion protein
MRRKILPLVLVVAAASFAAWWFYFRPRPSDALLLSGSIEARTVQVGSLVGGRVKTVHADEGATVAAGQPLVTLEPDLLDLQIAEQRTQIESLSATLARTRIGPRTEEQKRNEIAWRAAQTNRKRQEALWKGGVVSRQEYDNAVVVEQSARQTLDEGLRGGTREDVEAARATLAGAGQRLAYLERQRKEMVVSAPAAGVIEAMDLRPGDLVAPNQAVATILERDQLWVRVFVPEPELGHVHIGQPAAVQIDTFPNRRFSGRVVEIRQQGEYTPRNIQTPEQRSDQVFGVKVRIDPVPELKAGMAATVHLEPDAAPPAVQPTVPGSQAGSRAGSQR